MIDRGRVREVYAEAIELAPEKVGEFLDSACGADLELRREVESLLAVAARRPQFLGSPTAAPPVHHQAVGEGAGSRIGHYRLLQEIGQGGFGQVFMAEQSEPVRRMVALKIIKLGMDTRQVVARFEQERQALAMMDHPNIATVFDAGVTETGRPYFVMELVRGIPITKFCDEQRLTVRERIDLLVPVCHAVQHAHQKGIIHRDLKPGNILVTLHDGRPVPKVIDFGIAKATNARLTEKTLFTEIHQMVGTPAYMSPEQAEMSGLDIDTRSDVYSLGVLLYELVTGTTPFTEKELLHHGYAEIQRVIREVEPPRPSTRVSTQRETLASIAAQRKADPARLPALLRGDLDWMVMKCLEKDRRRRYHTVDALCADLMAYSEGREVTAVPPTTAYRVRKFVSRNRALVTAGAVVCSTLVLGIAGTTAGLFQAQRAKAEAITNAKLADANAEKAGKEAVRADAQAEEARASARAAEAVNDLMRSMIGRADRAKEEGRTDVTVREVMDAAAADLESGATTSEPKVATTLAKTIAETYRELNLLEPAERMMRLFHRLTGEHFGERSFEKAESANRLGEVLKKRGNLAEARELYALTRAIAAELGDRGVELGAASVANEAIIDAETGNLEKAKADLRAALTLLQSKGLGDSRVAVTGTKNLAVMLWSSGNRSEAQAVYARSLELLRKRGSEPDRVEMLHTLAVFQAAERDYAAAEKTTQEEVALCRKLYGERHLDLAGALEGHSLVLRARDKPHESIAAGREAVAIYRSLLGPRHTLLAGSLGKLGMVLVEAGKFDEAEPILREQCEVLVTLMPPGESGFVHARYLLARTLAHLGNKTEAASLLRQALADSETTITEGSRNWWMRGGSGCLLAGIVAESAEQSTDPAERLRLIEEALSLRNTYAERLLALKNQLGPRNSRMVIGSSLDQVVRVCEIAAQMAPGAERDAALTTWRARREEFLAGLAK